MGYRACASVFVLFGVACSAGEEPGQPTVPRQLEAVRWIDKASTPVAGDVSAAALGYVRGIDALTAPDDDWRVRSASRGQDQLHHVRLEQLHEGVRVWNGEVVVHATDARFRSVTGNRVRGLTGLDVTPVATAEQALATAKADHARSIGRAPGSLAYTRDATELVILPRSGDTRLAWHTTFYIEQDGVMPGRWNYFVDAHGGAVLHKFNAMDTLSQASGPGGNPNVARTWTMALDVEPSGGQYVMSTAKFQTYNMNHSQTGSGTLVTGPLNPIGDAAINDAHGFAEVTVNMMNTWFGHNSIDDAGFVIKSRVHFGNDFENAFWDGEQMTYGDGDTALYALSGDVDVVAHEISHGYTEFHSNLVYDGESGGLNESFSDVAGTAADFFFDAANGEFDIGADLFIGSGVIRFMCDPTADGLSIDHYSDYAGQDVHFSSGIANKAFCRAARRLGAGGNPDGAATAASVRRAAEAWYEANASYWTAGTTFEQGCQGVMDAAAALGFSATEQNRLRDSWVDVGVFCDGAVEPIECTQTLTANSGTISSPNYPNDYPNEYAKTWCIRPASGGAATLMFTAFSTEADYDFVRVRDGNTGATLSTSSGTMFPPDATSTWIAVTFTSDQAVTENGWQAMWTTGTAPLPDASPGTPDAAPGTPDAAPGTPDAAPGTPDAAPGTPDAAPGTPDAEAGGPDAGGEQPDDEGGCCSTGSNGGGSLLLAGLVGIALFRPRRRRA